MSICEISGKNKKASEIFRNLRLLKAPSVAKNLKDKMHTVKAMERRFEKEDENMTQMPEQEEAIFVKLGDENSHIPAGKTVIEYELSKLVTPDGKRILAEGRHVSGTDLS